jgi:hypothetical protein
MRNRNHNRNQDWKASISVEGDSQEKLAFASIDVGEMARHL